MVKGFTKNGKFRPTEKKANNFNMKQYEKLNDTDDYRDGTTATMNLVEKYGTPSELKRMKDLHEYHQGTGYLTNDLGDEVNNLDHKYFGRLMPTIPLIKTIWHDSRKINNQPYKHKTHLSGSYIGKTKMIRD
jgi:hypothetical protein